MAARESNPIVPNLRIDQAARESLSLHWSAIFAGVFVSILIYFALMSLGLAVGAGALRGGPGTDEPFPGLALGAGVWTVCTVLFSLFAGSYASGRVSGIIATRIGYTQGAVITTLFFMGLVSQIGVNGGIFSRYLHNISSSALGASVSGMVRNPRLANVIEDHISGLNMRVPHNAAVQGLQARLVRGDTESARMYLTAITGLPPTDAGSRMVRLSSDFQNQMRDVINRSSEASSRLGWAAFVTLTLGTLAAMLGGGTGAMVNLRKPLDRVDERALRRVPAYP